MFEKRRIFWPLQELDHSSLVSQPVAHANLCIWEEVNVLKFIPELDVTICNVSNCEFEVNSLL